MGLKAWNVAPTLTASSMYALVQLSFLVLTARAEDIRNADTDDILAFSVASSSNRIEEIVLSFFFWLISFVSTLLAALLGSFAYHESQLMQQYKWQGVRVNANVWNTEFVRMRRQTKACSSCCQPCDLNHSQLDGADSELDNEEYIAIIEYRLIPEVFERDVAQKASGVPCVECPSSTFLPSDPVLPTDNCLVVRKQVKACRSDFSATQAKSAACANSDIHRVHLDFRDSPAKDTQDKTAVDSVPQLLFLHVLVVPGHKNSGLPHQQVERMCSISYQLPTIVVCLGLLVLVVLSSFLGVRSFLKIRSPEDEMTVVARASSLGLSLGTAIVVALNLFSATILSSCAVSNWIKQILRAEYLDGGDEVLPPPLGDSYSISSGDDAYLMF